MRHQGQSSSQKDFRTGVAAEQLHSRPGRMSENLSILFLFFLIPSFVFELFTLPSFVYTTFFSHPLLLPP
jgi:hypothetical protein